MFSHTLAIGMPGLPELLIIGAIGLLVFGKRLPEVGRGLGQAIWQFKKGLSEASDEITQVDTNVARPVLTNQTQTPVVTAPATITPEMKFDPYTGKPIEKAAVEEPVSASH